MSPIGNIKIVIHAPWQGCSAVDAEVCTALEQSCNDRQLSVVTLQLVDDRHSTFPISVTALLCRTFPDFANVFCSEQHVDEDECAALVECY